MAYSATGIPVVVRYDAAGRPTGLRETGELNVTQLNVATISATVIAAGTFEGADGGSPTFTVGNLSDVGDVVFPSGISNDQVLRWDAASAKWYPSDAVETVPLEPTTTFLALTDTPGYYFNDRILKSTSDGLTYSNYSDASIAALSATVVYKRLEDLSGVNIDSPAENDYIRYVGGEWVNDPLSISNIAEKVQIDIRNESGETLERGTVVFASGTHGTSAKILTVGKASTSLSSLEDKLLGVLDSQLTNNSTGNMTVIGYVTDFNTALSGIASSSLEGSPVYIDPNVPGSITSIRPTQPTPILEVGILTRRHATNGEIFVRFLRGGRLETLYNVYIPTKTIGDAVVWNGTTYGVSAHAVSGLRDTQITSIATNHSLIWDGTKWVNKFPTITTLSDVNITTPTNGDRIAYDSTTSSWKNYSSVTTVPLEGDQGKAVLIASGGTQYYYSPNFVYDYPTNKFTFTSNVTGLNFSGSFYGDGSGLSGITAEWDGSYVGDATISGSLSVTGNVSGTGNLNLGGNLTAAAKSFLIDHPTKEGMKLQYTCLEGPENGVYCRGRVKTNVILLPDYWIGLVDEDTITVNLTPAGKKQPNLFVEDIRDNKIFLSSSESIDCFYTIFGERKDIDKLIVEF